MSENLLPGRLLSSASVRSKGTGLTVVSLIAVLGAGILTAWDDVFAGLFAWAFCCLFLVIFVRAHRLEVDERNWLLGICLIGFALRVIVASAILKGPWDPYMFGEDQLGYDHIPMTIAREWTGETYRSIYESSVIVQMRKGYFYFVALQYYVLGHSLIVPRIFNCLGGALIVFYSARLAARVFGAAEGRVAGAWTALFPSLVMWSAVNLRDIWLALSVVAIVHHAFVLRDRLSAGSLAAVTGYFVWIHFNRSYLVLIMVAACLAIFIFARSRGLARDLAVAGALCLVLLFLHQSMGLGSQGMEWLDLERIAEQREKLALTAVGRSGYLGDLDISDPFVLIAASPLLIAYFLFSPFPWQMTVPRRLITAPEMLFWYWLTPFVFVAFRYVLRERAKRQLALLMSLAIITIAFAIPSGNMGLAYRYRAQIIPLFLAFAAAGYIRRRSRASQRTVVPGSQRFQAQGRSRA